MTKVLGDLPLISICIPAYNAAPYIKEAIEGWTLQTYKNIEIIIQDDCSIDDTYFLAKELGRSDTRIKVFKNIVNLGIGKNWNEAYNKVKGDYICVFNADDLIFPDFLSISLKIFEENPQIDFVIHNYKRSILGDNHHVFEKFIGLTKDLVNSDKQNPKRIHWNFTLAKSKSLVRLKNDYGLFYPTQVCDAMLWFEAQKKNLVAYYLGQPQGVYRDHEHNNSKIKFGEFDSTFLWMIPIYPEIFNMVHPKKSIKSFKMLCSYIYHSLINFRLPNFTVIKNIIIYRI